MADDRGQPEAIAEAARFLQHNLADAQTVKKVRRSVKSQRDCGAASAVGGATVAISLLIGDGKVTLHAFYVLLFAQGLLIVAAQFFTYQSARLMARNVPFHETLGFVFAALVISGLGPYLTTHLRQHESNAGSSSWWLLLGLAAVGALLGLIIRRSAEALMEELDDESWKQRVAPLVSEQEKAIAEMWRMGVLLKDAPPSSVTESG